MSKAKKRRCRKAEAERRASGIDESKEETTTTTESKEEKPKPEEGGEAKVKQNRELHGLSLRFEQVFSISFAAVSKGLNL